MAFNWLLPVRVVQFIFAIIVLGLTAYVANWWNGFYYEDISPSEVNFLIFTSVWTILTLIYLIVVPWRFGETIAAHKFGILAAEALAMLFWFAGFIALAVFLSPRLCYGRVCDAAKAADVFAAFSWLLFAATTALAVVHVFRTHRTRHEGPPPQMSEGV